MHSSRQHTSPSSLQNVVTSHYNAPLTPPSTARPSTIDDDLDSLVPAIPSNIHYSPRTETAIPRFSPRPEHQMPHNGYKHKHTASNTHPSAFQQQHYPTSADEAMTDDMEIDSVPVSGLLTPVSITTPEVKKYIPSRYSPAKQPVRTTKGKYQISDFAILRTLGTGSFGRVHLVQSRHNSRFYAIKVLKKAQVVKMKQVEHTNDERAMLQAVKHPFLVNLWGTFQDHSNLYMVMDFIEGGELFSLLRKSHRFPNPVAKFYAAEVALALNYLHSQEIIYRDLKPENVLLDRHGHVKITDFGFAKRVEDITWTLCGTPDYLAPEIISSKGYNKSVDWWSLGILTFEMLAGYPPFYDPNPMKLYENITSGRLKFPSYFDTQAKDLLSRLLTADLSKRYGNLKNGSADVFLHSWFSEVSWERLEKREIDAPYVPPIKPGGGDASQFDKYDEDDCEEYGDFGSDDKFGHLFVDF